MPTSTPLTVTRQNIKRRACTRRCSSVELQQSDNPTTNMVAEAITRTMQRFGTDGCAGQMAPRARRSPPTRRPANPDALGVPASLPGPALPDGPAAARPASTLAGKALGRYGPRAAGSPAALNQI